MQQCKANEVAIKIAPLNDIKLPWTCNLPNLGLRVKEIKATGGTPLYWVTQENIKSDEGVIPNRMVLFSDGEPDNGMERPFNDETQKWGEPEFSAQHKATIEAANKSAIPLDTIWIAPENYDKESNEYRIMKDLADKTGGIFLVFEKGKVNLAHALRYLAPGLRGYLMDSNFREAVESGQQK